MIDIEETLAMRQSIIHHTADIFDPDIFIVDKEPLGLRGEVKNTLMMLKDRGVPAGPGPARRDGRAGPAGAGVGAARTCSPALRDLYDDIWVYGLPQICDPLAGHRAAALGAAEDDLYGLPASQPADQADAADAAA